MRSTQSNYQDLTLDFIGDQEVLVIIPKFPSKEIEGIEKLSAISPKSAIIAKKLTTTKKSSEENLDSNAYAISFEPKEYNDKESLSTPFSTRIYKALEESSANSSKPKSLISKDYLLKNFHICGILNTDKLKSNSPDTNNLCELETLIELFPETKSEFLEWVR
jgi:hypothetical protein